MNYLHMIAIKKILQDQIVAQACFQSREEVFRESLPFVKVIPLYLILEASFQTVGRLARYLTQDRCGAYVVSFNKFCFKRALFADENLLFLGKFINKMEDLLKFKIDIQADEEPVLTGGEIILKQSERIENATLNHETGEELKLLKKKYIYAEKL